MRQVLVSDMLADKAQQVADSLGRGTVVVSMDDVNAGAPDCYHHLKCLLQPHDLQHLPSLLLSGDALT
jgi:hypothetical protein